jgi:hypothetical protein
MPLGCVRRFRPRARLGGSINPSRAPATSNRTGGFPASRLTAEASSIGVMGPFSPRGAVVPETYSEVRQTCAEKRVCDALCFGQGGGWCLRHIQRFAPFVAATPEQATARSTREEPETKRAIMIPPSMDDPKVPRNAAGGTPPVRLSPLKCLGVGQTEVGMRHGETLACSSTPV